MKIIPDQVPSLTILHKSTQIWFGYSKYVRELSSLTFLVVQSFAIYTGNPNAVSGLPWMEPIGIVSKTASLWILKPTFFDTMNACFFKQKLAL